MNPHRGWLPRCGLSTLVLAGIFIVLEQFRFSVQLESGERNSKRIRQTAEEQLMKDLFRSYDTDARAVLNSSSTVTVKINYMLMRIQGLDERSQVLTTTGLVLGDWMDERLVWDPALYNNINDIVVRANRIWIPELAIINGAEEIIQEFEKIRVQIRSDGRIHWEPGGVFSTTCDIDILYFPFDTQACPIEIGAWAYKSSRMNLTNVQTEVEIQDFRINGEWNIISTSAKWREVVLPGYEDNKYSKVVFTIRMRRRSTFYLMNIILPCSLLSVLVLVVFCVPPSAGEKISIGISVLLAFTVFLLMLADSVPRTSLVVPILVIYLGCTMSLGTASVCLTVIVLNIHHRDATTEVPRWARFVLRLGARVFGLVDTSRLRNAPNATSREASVPDSVAVYPPGSDKLSAVCYAEGRDNHLMRETLLYHRINVDKLAKGICRESRTREKSATAAARVRRTRDDVLSRLNQESVDQEIINEWHLLAKVFDRIFFIVVSFLMTSSATLILTSPWYMNG